MKEIPQLTIAPSITQSSIPITFTILVRTYVRSATAINARMKNGIIMPKMKGRFDSAALAANASGLSVGVRAAPPVATAVALLMVEDIVKLPLE